MSGTRSAGTRRSAAIGAAGTAAGLDEKAAARRQVSGATAAKISVKRHGERRAERQKAPDKPRPELPTGEDGPDKIRPREPVAVDKPPDSKRHSGHMTGTSSTNAPPETWIREIRAIRGGL
jgi:hypothetical protein